MRLKIDKSFEKDTDKLQDAKLLIKIANCIEQIVTAPTKEEILNLKKLKGFKHHYRIRIGDYRIGAVILDEEVVLDLLSSLRECCNSFISYAVLRALFR